MKKIILALVAVAVVAGVVCTKISFTKQTPKFLLDNVEALAWDEYHKGIEGTNWETYSIKCVAYGESSSNSEYTWDGSVGIYVAGTGVEVGIGGEASSEDTTNYEPVTYTKDICGKGMGFCYAPAPDGHPCNG